MDFPNIKGYRILSLVGRGGMGAVYRAADETTGREVALKVLGSALSADEEFVLRFKREAAALGALVHPGIARFVASGTSGDLLYFAMEYVDGEVLCRRLADGPLPVDEACRTASQVAEALAAAHEAGIIHRDVKSSNIILSPAGAKLTDFGLARRGDATGLTTSGRVMGSLPYMSPEQIRGEKLEPASDVYSLGVVLYEMLTAQLPYSGAGDEALATRIFTQPAPLVSHRRPDVPVGLDVLLVRMLAKDPALRPQSAREAAERLRELSGSPARRGRAARAEAPRRGEGFIAGVSSALCRLVVRALPAGGLFDRFADRACRWPLSLAADGGKEKILLEAALVRRKVKTAKKELRLLERRRNKRLRGAELAQARREALTSQKETASDAARAHIREARIDHEQDLERLAHRMRGDAEIFEQRISDLSEAIVADTKRIRTLEEMAGVPSADPGRR